MRNKEIITKTYTAEAVTSIECDGCGKKIEGITQAPKEWYEFYGHHEQWGNDSIDSYEYYDVCCGDCYVVALKTAFEEFKDYRTAEIDDKPIEFIKSLLTSTLKD